MNSPASMVPGLQRLEHVAAAHRLHRHAEPRAHLRREAGGAEAQALQIVDRGDLVLEPAGPLRPAIAAEEGLQAEAAVHLVVERLAAAMGQPADLLGGEQAERLRAEQQDALGLRAPIGRHRMVELGRAFRDRVEDLVAGHDLARGEELDLDPPAGERGDAVGQHLCRDAGPWQVLRPGRHHLPAQHVLGDGRLGKARGGRADPGADRGTAGDDRATLQALRHG